MSQACSELDRYSRPAFYDDKQLPHDKMRDYHRSLDVYVHVSFTEGVNNTVIEALACNIPVIMTRQGVWMELDGYVENKSLR